jgi:hypothetical protein
MLKIEMNNPPRIIALMNHSEFSEDDILSFSFSNNSDNIPEVR